jgi:hypothetical protein
VAQNPCQKTHHCRWEKKKRANPDFPGGWEPTPEVSLSAPSFPKTSPLPLAVSPFVLKIDDSLLHGAQD